MISASKKAICTIKLCYNNLIILVAYVMMSMSITVSFFTSIQRITKQTSNLDKKPHDRKCWQLLQKHAPMHILCVPVMHTFRKLWSFFSVTTIYLTKLKAQPHFQRVAALDKSIGTKNGFHLLIKESPKCS